MASADTRTTHTDALAVLGTIIDETIGRDAIHLAVEPVVAISALEPGQRIGFTKDGKPVPAEAKLCVTGCLGIVDPFLTKRVLIGHRFLMILLPGQIATLRHVWDHPAFPASTPGGTDLGVAPAAAPVNTTKADDAKAWLTQYASAQGVDYEQMIKDTMRWSEYDDEPWWADTDADHDEFWNKMDALLGITLTRGTIDFSCQGC